MRKKKTYWFLLTITILMYISFGLLTSVIGVIIERFRIQYDVSLQIAALLPFAFYLSYGLLSIPFGMAMDRISPRFVLLLGMVIMTVGSFLFYFSSNYLVVIFMIFLTGAGVTAIQTAGNPFIRELDIPKRYTANLTIIVGIGALGYAVSPILLPLTEAGGLTWNTVYLFFGIINAVLLFLLIIAKFPAITISAEEKIQTSVILILIKKPIIITYALGIFFYVGAEVGTSSYIISFMEKIHGIGVNESLWKKGSFLASVFPSVSAMAVAAFWLFQAVGRLIIGPIMKYVKPRKIFMIHSALTCITLLITIYSPAKFALIGFALTGYFTCASFTSIFSAAIQSFDKYHGTISGILCTAIVGGAVLGFLVGFAGDILNLQVAMYINILAFLYIFSLAVWGKGKLDFA
ncbi:MAG: sugar MFS transporter [Chlorobi bacterium]|nr:sugar MFS transporter [Chlorobiota bacterium]